MKFMSYIGSIILFATLGAVLSLIVTVALLDLPQEQVISGVIIAATLGAICGILLERRNPNYVWVLIIDGIFGAF